MGKFLWEGIAKFVWKMQKKVWLDAMPLVLLDDLLKKPNSQGSHQLPTAKIYKTCRAPESYVLLILNAN